MFSNYLKGRNDEKAKEGVAELSVYNLLGEKVANLIYGKLEAGKHTYIFNASELPSGIYLYKLEYSGYSIVKKMSLVK